MPTETGIFTQEEAKTGHAFSYRLAEYIAETFAKKLPLYDYGCGPGTYLKYFKDVGFHNLTGIEGTPANEIESEVASSLILRRDLSQPLNLGMNLGNVICIEVGEHIPAESEQTFIDNICAQLIKGGLLIISWAHPGQLGYGHVNCQPDWYVIEQLEQRGLLHIPDRTAELRALIEGHMAYLRENIFVFTKPYRFTNQ